jgi:ANTAR domain
MSEISAEEYAAALGPVVARLLEMGERGERVQAALDSRIVERAESAISIRLDTTSDVAYEILSGLARSQGREIAEYAEAVVARGGQLDA